MNRGRHGATPILAGVCVEDDIVRDRLRRRRFATEVAMVAVIGLSLLNKLTGWQWD